MAEPQLVVRNSAGQIVLDSRNAAAGCCVEILIIPAGSATVTRTYPEFVGRTAMVLSGLMHILPTTDTALGYPRVTFTGWVVDRHYAIFIL